MKYFKGNTVFRPVLQVFLYTQPETHLEACLISNQVQLHTFNIHANKKEQVKFVERNKSQCRKCL